MNQDEMIEYPKLLSFHHGGALKYGLLRPGGVVDLWSRFGARWPSLQAVIVAGELAQLVESGARLAADLNVEDIRFAIPIAIPEKIICVGVNYPERNAEYKDGQEAPAYPSLFIRFPRSFVGHGEALVRPLASRQLDYEGEIALVIGKCGRHIPQSEAYGHIAALSLCNEGTLRDWVRHAGAMGPWLVSFMSRAQIDDIRLTTRVNGDTRQDDRTSRMIFGVAYLIAYISTFTTLAPGDIIVSGTPSGAGARRDPPVFLSPGDVIEVEAEGIGILRNAVVDET
jgi:2-keto-4-pentenoate hydratase/2-oxohepta-3-ene-1,7-dioic acid hydratase in catechol pathway